MANTPLTIPTLLQEKKWNDYRDEIYGDSYNWAWNRKTTEVKYVVIHHSVTTHDATPDDVALLHKARGWLGIGYHFVITKDGVVYYVGDVGTARANVLDLNEQVIGICLIGDFTKFLPSAYQVHSAHLLTKWFLEQKQVWPNLKLLVGHKDLTPTACPGSNWPNDLKSRIENDFWTGYPAPTPVAQPIPIPIPPIPPVVDYKVLYEKEVIKTKELTTKITTLTGDLKLLQIENSNLTKRMQEIRNIANG